MFKDFIVDLKDFKIISQLGEGEFGKVFLIEQNKTNKKFTAKIGKMEYTSTQEQNDFLQKISTYSNIKSPSILSLHGFSQTDFESNNKPTIITEYMSQGSLNNFINGKNQLKSSEKYIILLGIAEGLNYLHSKKINHLNLKPNNVLLDQNNFPYLCDFGKHQITDTEDSIIISNRGTKIYMAPEVYSHESSSDKSDVFSFSILAYELITETFPYQETRNLKKMHEDIREGKRPDLSLIKDSVIQNLLTKCWSIDPKNRPNFSKIIEIMKEKSFMKAMNVENEEKVNSYLDLFTEKLPPLRSSVKITNKKEKNKKITKNTIMKNEADNGDPNAMLKYAEILENKNYIKESKKYYKMAAGKGNVSAMKKCVSMFDGIESIKYLKMAADRGDVESMNKYGKMLLEGEEVDTNYEEAIRYIKMSVDEGDPEGMRLYGIMLFEGFGIDENREESVRYYKMSADKGNIDAIRNYGDCLRNGDGIETNKKEAARYFKIAADKGCIKAMNDYADMLFKGEEIIVDKKEAARYYKMAADKGDEDGMSNLSYMLFNGDGIDTNKEEAAKYYKLLAQKGDFTAIKQLAYMFYTGDGVDSNEEEAAHYFKMLADDDNEEGMEIYGSMMYNSECKKDGKKKAAHYFKSLANFDNVNGMKFYAFMLRNGIDIDVNKELAAHYYKMAADKGDTEAMAFYANMIYNKEVNESDKNEALEIYKTIFKLK